MITHENDGFYLNVKTGKIVHVDGTRHNMHLDGNIHISFTGTRDGMPYGRSFKDYIENFMDRHSWVGREA